MGFPFLPKMRDFAAGERCMEQARGRESKLLLQSSLGVQSSRLEGPCCLLKTSVFLGRNGFRLAFGIHRPLHPHEGSRLVSFPLLIFPSHVMSLCCSDTFAGFLRGKGGGSGEFGGPQSEIDGSIDMWGSDFGVDLLSEGKVVGGRREVVKKMTVRIKERSMVKRERGIPRMQRCAAPPHEKVASSSLSSS
jgi:hypothetical protein